MALTQDLRTSAIIAYKDNNSIERRNKIGMKLKEILYSFLRGKTIEIKYSSSNSGKGLILSSLVKYQLTVDLERENLRVIFLSKVCYQSMIVECRGSERRISTLDTLTCYCIKL